MVPTFDVPLIGDDWEEKVWGWVWHVYISDQAAVSFLKTKKGYRCSKHRHRHRANMFAVIAGEIEIQEWGYRGKGMMKKILQSGDTYAVPSGRYHRFRVLESGMVIEVYWVDVRVRLEDIERLDEGGVDDEQNS